MILTTYSVCEGVLSSLHYVVVSLMACSGLMVPSLEPAEGCFHILARVQ